MSHFSIIKQCIVKLDELMNELHEISGKTQSESGYNCAISCARDSIQSRLDMLSEALEDFIEISDEVNEEAECISCITSAISVLEGDVEDASSNSLFDNSFREKLKEVISNLYVILDDYN